MAIDSHMHINSQVLTDQDYYISRIINNPKLAKVINVGLDLTTSKEAINIASSNPKFYATVGIHPAYIKSQDLAELPSLASNDSVVAIGEIGLDATVANYEEQRRYFIAQIILANELHLPVIIHSNNANKMVIAIFKNIVRPQYGCVFHCFQPDLTDLAYLVDQGYYISFAGRITYKNAQKSLAVASQVPENLFLVETDSPYIAPEPLRGTTNESANISYIIQKLSAIREKRYEEIERITTTNTLRLFKKLQ